MCLMLALLGCKKLANLKKTGEAPASSGTAAGPASDSQLEQDEKLSTKLEGYIDCLNRASRDAFESRNSYLMRIDEAKGPTGKENGVWIREVDPRSCLQALDKAKTLPPSLPDLDVTVGPYRAALEALVPLAKAAHDYYDRKDFKDDKWAEGKQMHGPLMAACTNFQKANEPFENKVVALNEELGDRRLARLAQDPARKLEYMTQVTAKDAKKLVKLAEVPELAKLDAAAYGVQLQAYEKDFNELEQYASSHKSEADKVLMFSTFMSAGSDYLKSAKELLRRKRDNEDPNREVGYGSPKNVEGHPAQVLDKYNTLVDRLNGLRFRE